MGKSQKSLKESSQAGGNDLAGQPDSEVENKAIIEEQHQIVVQEVDDSEIVPAITNS